MSATKYTYSIQNDFPNSLLNIDSLTNEIRGSNISIALDFIGTTGDICDIWFKDTLLTEHETTLNTLVENHVNDPLPEDAASVHVDNFNITDSGKLQVAQYKSEGSSKTFVTHDWCDKTTWYQKATKVTNEALIVDTGLTYVSTNEHVYWIDLDHGKLYDESVINADGEYSAVIKVDNVVIPTDAYTLDYKVGSVTFEADPSGAVTADYYYAGSSEYSIIPDSGKILHLEHSEMQFASDVMINTPMNFEIWVYNPYDLPNKIRYRQTKYKSAKDFVNSCNLGQGQIPAFADLILPTIVFPFNYTTLKTVKSSQGAELRLRCDDDLELTGSFGTCTFYTISEDE